MRDPPNERFPTDSARRSSLWKGAGTDPRGQAAQPYQVSGTRRTDFILTRAGAGAWLTKIGADGVHAMAIESRGWGIAIKIADGSARVQPVVAASVLRQLGLLQTTADEDLKTLEQGAILNCRGLETGRIQAVFELDRPW